MPHRGKGLQILFVAVLIEFCLGTGFGWSLFVKPLMDLHGWSRSQVTLAYSLYVSFNGLAYLLVGYWADRNPRRTTFLGGLLFGFGILVGGLAVIKGWLYLLYAGYGLLAGLGIGMPYLAVLSVIIKWFSHRKGLATGIVLVSFGSGAIVMGVILPGLILRFGPGMVLLGMGALSAFVCGPLGLLIKNPPEQQNPPQENGGEPESIIPWYVLRQGRFYGLWGIMFVLIGSGVAIFSQAAIIFQERYEASSAAAGSLVAIMAVSNSLGRLFWSSLSDQCGRRAALIGIILIQAAAFFLMVQSIPSWAFQLALCTIAFNYGGNCGTMPAFTADLFGADKVGRIYGPIISAQATAGLISPLLFAWLRDWTGSYNLPAYLTVAALLCTVILPLIISRPQTAVTSEPAVG
jgi:OFA family oxalate/formate antiporter-like MFS transporter